MKLVFLTIGLFFAFLQQGIGQVPQKFSYQAVIRNSDGSVMANQAINVKVTLRKVSAAGTEVYTETQNVTTTGQGLISLSIGEGDAASFALIPWSENIFIQVEVKKTTEATFQNVGTSQILSVPYALRAGSVKEVVSQATANDDDPIFEVKNKEGKVVFGVYQGGVRIYVDDSPAIKGAKGGFAVGGLTLQAKGGPVEYMRITPDSARIYINDATTKGAKGGFAVGGLTLQSKGKPAEYLRITSDSARIYINDATTKGAKGGFAVGGLTLQSKSLTNDYFKVTKDSSFFTNTIFTQGDIISTGNISTGAGIASTPALDIDGNIYQTVKIGTQIWMKENLRTTRYSYGQPIAPNEKVYNNTTNADTIKAYGRLYSYFAIADTSNVCPIGWHVPTQVDWDSLMVFVGGPYWKRDSIVTGLKLMETGTPPLSYWSLPNNANNASGFSGRPGGRALVSTQWFFSSMGSEGNWWVKGGSQIVRINGNDGSVSIPGASPDAYSVRCVKGKGLPSK